MNPDPPSASAAGTAPGSDTEVLTHTGARELRKREAIRKHDFRQSGFLAPSELRRIRLRHEQFVRALAARFAIFLRLEFTVQLAKLQIVSYQKFTETLPASTHITLFKTDPLKGVGLLVIPPRLGLTLVDRLLGGPGRMSDANRELSEIEVALLDQAATLLLTEWCNHWPEMRDLHPALLGHETNSRFLQTAPPETAMLLISLQAGLGDQLETVQIAIPYATLEPLVRLLCPAGMPDSDSPPSRPAAPRWNTQFNDVPVPVTAEWQGLKVSTGDLSRLQPGDVLVLEPQCAAQVHLRLSHVPKFIGRPGTRAGKWAIELTRPAAH